MIYIFLYKNTKDLCNCSELTLDFEIVVEALLYSLFEDEDLVLIDLPLPKYWGHFFVQSGWILVPKKLLTLVLLRWSCEQGLFKTGWSFLGLVSCFLDFALRFWNQTWTLASDRPKFILNSSLMKASG